MAIAKLLAIINDARALSSKWREGIIFDRMAARNLKLILRNRLALFTSSKNVKENMYSAYYMRGAPFIVALGICAALAKRLKLKLQ